MEKSSLLLYGANGYTGQLIVDICHEYGIVPILAARREEAIRPLAEHIGTQYRVVELSDQEELRRALADVKVVLHAAGPFKFTARPMIEACLATQTHYLDITGEIEVFELAKQYDEAARKAGVMVLPGAGFDVVPTDCLALYLKKQLPDATHLKLAFETVGGGLSHGTASTMVEGLGVGGAVRENGKIVSKKLGHKSMWLEINGRKRFFMTIPWGDVSTAYHTTGIPNIETYTGISPKVHNLLRFQGLYNWLLGSALVKKIAKSRVDKITGPTEAMRRLASSHVWGEVINASGNRRIAQLTCPEGYTLTAHSSLIIAKKVLDGNFKAGYQTPASAYGEDLVLEVPGVERVG
ncbi:saccharopine dehydrogenase family protein [Telluribacter humicola]|uniref:saccharopine dehydrogenase family protein n=1 Tax=Telluribacter humicola TaxID=1720261 RepID=UPI001A9641C2|nr:saccharopine dehydrogenase NADP-binding domain-containing protein [Telluribacter humicola]